MLADVFSYLTDGGELVRAERHRRAARAAAAAHRDRPGRRRGRSGCRSRCTSGHRRRGGVVAVNVSNVGRAVPVFAVLLVLALGPIGSEEFGPYGRAGLATLIALVLFALPPIITNAYVGVRRGRPRRGRGRPRDGDERAQGLLVGRAAARDAGGADRRPARPGAGLGDRDHRRAGRRPGAGPDHHPRLRQPPHLRGASPARSWSRSARCSSRASPCSASGTATRCAGPAGDQPRLRDRDRVVPGLSVAGVRCCRRGCRLGCPSDTRGARPRDTEGGCAHAPHSLHRRRPRPPPCSSSRPAAAASDPLGGRRRLRHRRQRRQGRGRRRRPELHREPGDGRDLPAAAGGRRLRRSRPSWSRPATSTCPSSAAAPSTSSRTTSPASPTSSTPRSTGRTPPLVSSNDAGRDPGGAGAAGRGARASRSCRRRRPPTRTPSSSPRSSPTRTTSRRSPTSPRSASRSSSARRRTARAAPTARAG